MVVMLVSARGDRIGQIQVPLDMLDDDMLRQLTASGHSGKQFPSPALPLHTLATDCRMVLP